MEAPTRTSESRTLAETNGEETTRIRLAIKTPSGPLSLNETAVRAFFQRYSHHLQAALDDVIDGATIAKGFWADQFVNSSPDTLVTGSDPQHLASSIDEVLSGYKQQGMRRIHVRDIDVNQLDDCHAVASVGWSLFRDTNDSGHAGVDFDASYFVKQAKGTDMRIFGWVEGRPKTI
ncbi:uncharacterized protein HMPREF1541_10969 [Cyphellophora europaea CBS 101466]|uniref:SnoaL-like domain-containing protein n=1 Tax=Cyphellophora europaea (strain CBS 101466) TaxID=1220924 RepID=W2S715_CYPE1|nr:uncharacterized protein HMPREF1541_10969 [Cyphellophora europaea CBS 101466]ETN43838.1 hypothetical protein HMPREF1541_10969 [Cyphellophora europaea CBS 101466]